MDRTRFFQASLALAALATAALWSSCASVQRTVTAAPQIEGAHFTGNKSCAECHTNYTRTFTASAHGRFHRDDERAAGMTGCESCHGPGSRHIEGGGGRRHIINPRQDGAVCLNCHVQTRAEFNLPHHHPLPGGRLTCTACHDPHGGDIHKPSRGLALTRVNESCASCHREQARRFVFEHQALREGCVTCHSPHGSINAKLLTQRDANMCLRCHAQVQGGVVPAGSVFIGTTDHTAFLRRGTCWSAGCHTSVHGSNVDHKLRY
jgi:predicted CXXCH cytochrome family protein